MELIESCIKSAHKPVKVEFDNPDPGEPHPLVVKPIVDLNKP